MNDCSTIVGQLVQRRKQLGLSQVGVGARIGVAQHNLSEWERGERKPTLESAIKWARALNYEIRLSPQD